MQDITPHFWFDKEAREAANFYTSIFPNSKINYIANLPSTPSGEVEVVSFVLSDHPFMAISAGPLSKPNPTISFILNFDPSKDSNAKDNLNLLWKELEIDGKILLPLDTYPYSELFGWVEEKFGISWQLIYSDPEGDERPFIVPALLFVEDLCGSAEEAIDFYLSVFKQSVKGLVTYYLKGMDPDQEGTLMFGDFMLNGTWFAAMDSAYEHNFHFNEAISLVLPCQTQNEIDYYWEKLSAVPEAEQCGWLKDKFGVSWQVWPFIMGEMMNNGNREQINRLTQAFLPMKKFDIKKLKEAFNGF